MLKFLFLVHYWLSYGKKINSFGIVKEYVQCIFSLSRVKNKTLFYLDKDNLPSYFGWNINPVKVSETADKISVYYPMNATKVPPILKT